MGGSSRPNWSSADKGKEGTRGASQITVFAIEHVNRNGRLQVWNIEGRAWVAVTSPARTNSAAARGAHAARRGGGVLFVYADSGILDQLCPLEDFGFYHRCEFRRRVCDGLHAKVLQMRSRVASYSN